MRDKISAEFLKLAEYGNEIKGRTNFGPTANQPQLELAQARYFQFRTRALNLVGRACGTDSDHYLELRKMAENKESANNYQYFSACLGIVEAARHDYDAEILFDMKSLIAAELMGDLLEQVDALLQAGYYIPAASLAGAVLEDALRKLCVKHDIPLGIRTNINGLNTELAKAGEYNLLTQKQITSYADIRNNADHGHHDQFTKSDVEDMVKWVRRFTEEHLR